MKDRMQRTFRNVYEKGYTEYLSTTYEAVMNIPVMILYKYAGNQEVKDLAEAYLLYKYSLSALNNFEGHIIAPYSRSNRQPDNEPTGIPPGTAIFNWLLWGWGPNTLNINAEHFKIDATQWAVSAALLDIKPDDIFFKLAGHSICPFQHLSSASTFGTYGTGVPHMMMRKVYRDKLYSIGTGNFRWVPGGDYADHDGVSFNIVWHSTDKFNYIECNHPYWYSDGDQPTRHPDAWSKGSVSPFQQIAHDRNTAIVLYNIPEKDPWRETPNADKWSWRDANAENLIKRGQFRFPKSMDEIVEKDGWIVLREGEVYIGVKPLKDYSIQSDLTGEMEFFNMVKSDFAQCGFVFEAGTASESGSFNVFIEKLIKNKLIVDWKSMNVSYTSSQNNKLEIQYKTGLMVVKEDPIPEHWVRQGHKGMAESVPTVMVNGKPDPSYREWSMIASPNINLVNNVLEIKDNNKSIIVDWQGEKPVLKRTGI